MPDQATHLHSKDETSNFETQQAVEGCNVA